jgi:GTPase
LIFRTLHFYIAIASGVFMFIDKVTIHIESGSGGNGLISWRREKFVPNGGPAGGDGGRGGSVHLEATARLNTLLDFTYRSIYKAEDGEKGGNKDCHGKKGENLTVYVPCGTVVKDAKTGQIIGDLQNDGERILVAQGGRGGRGNARFTSSVQQAPHFAEPGEAGIIRNIELELKLIADVGLIGLPNAGKSTLISVVSAAKPKIANYPFTTLTPNLGVVKYPEAHSQGNTETLVFADIPGLIEGAHEGIGLGHDFLRHVERTRLLLHLVDIGSDPDTDPLETYDLINTELRLHSETLAKKPQVVVLTKADLLLEEEQDAIKTRFLERGITEVHCISSATGFQITPLVKHVFQKMEQLPKEVAIVDVVPDLKATDNDDSAFEVIRRGSATFQVTGGKVLRFASVTDMKNAQSLRRFIHILNLLGVFKSLIQGGAKPGDTILIGRLEFEFQPPEDAMEAHAEELGLLDAPEEEDDLLMDGLWSELSESELQEKSSSAPKK